MLRVGEVQLLRHRHVALDQPEHLIVCAKGLLLGNNSPGAVKAHIFRPGLSVGGDTAVCGVDLHGKLVVGEEVPLLLPGVLEPPGSVPAVFSLIAKVAGVGRALGKPALLLGGQESLRRLPGGVLAHFILLIRSLGPGAVYPEQSAGLGVQSHDSAERAVLHPLGVGKLGDDGRRVRFQFLLPVGGGGQGVAVQPQLGDGSGLLIQRLLAQRPLQLVRPQPLRLGQAVAAGTGVGSGLGRHGLASLSVALSQSLIQLGQVHKGPGSVVHIEIMDRVGEIAQDGSVPLILQDVLQAHGQRAPEQRLRLALAGPEIGGGQRAQVSALHGIPAELRHGIVRGAHRQGEAQRGRTAVELYGPPEIVPGLTEGDGLIRGVLQVH